ncbi:MAG: hypothetical protein ACK2UO_18260 [Caldilineaceae bacterium]|jgi:hypothetical protein
MISLVPPGVVLGLTLSALYAGVFHVWGGRTLRDLVAYFLAAAVGFGVGQAIGMMLHLPLPHIGQVYVIEGSVFAWLVMIGVRELRLGRPGQEVDHV